MGSTPRDRLTQIPLPTRSTEASTECFGRIVLSYLREDEQAEASFFILGDLLHRGIETAIDCDLDLAYMSTAWIQVEMEQLLSNINPAAHKIESSRRGFNTLFDDYQRMITNWFNHVHPDGEKRHPVYDDYLWPPKTEHEFYRTTKGAKYPVWGNVDALFEGKKLMEHGHMIVDWKSGTQRPKTDFQLQFYRFGLRIRGPNDHFHNLDRVRKPSIVQEAGPYPGDDKVLEAITLTERRKDAIVKGYMPKFSPDWYCGYCPVQHLCPADGDPRNRDGNRKDLERLLQKVEAMETIGG